MNINSTPSIPDLTNIVKNTYLKQIEVSLSCVESFSFDELLNATIRMYVSNPPEVEKKLLITDKFHIFRAIWKSVLECLYKDYLPSHRYEFSWKIEVSPYTLALCELTKNRRCDNEFRVIKDLLKITDVEFQDQYLDILSEIGMASLGFPDGLENIVPRSLLPHKRIDQLNLLFRLMNFPPLEEFAVFFDTYGRHVSSQIKTLSSAFPGIDAHENIGFKFQGAIGATYFNIDHATFKRRGLDGIEADLGRPEFKQDFAAIRKEAEEFSKKLKDVSICPCCGGAQEINLPAEAAQFRLLFQNRRLVQAASLLYTKEFALAQKLQVAEIFSSLFNKLNQVDNPDCLILVEGDSEEIAIPLMAIRSGILLSKNNIKVYNAKSKQKLEAEFMSYKAKFPKMKMICLLDADAKKESDNLSRLIKGNFDKYHLIRIKQGCFEDLFDLSDSIKILNKIYPDGEEIFLEDFDTKKDFGSNISRILHTKKRAKFEKVKFAKAISASISADKIPSEIKEILDVARKFSIQKKFISD
jgi:hypothetical protein